MANLSMLWDNKSAAATLAGGNWLASLPLANMQDRRLRKVARSANATTAATQFIVDMGGSGKYYRAIAVLSHSLTVGAQVRARCSNDAGFSTSDYDSGWRDAYEYTIPTTEANWEDDNWWTGKPLQSDLRGYSFNTTFVLPYLIDSRYIKIEINDTDNPAGCVDIGRLIIGPLTELQVNINYGATLSWLDKSTVSETLGGVEYFDARPKRRLFTCAAEYMDDAEALATIFEMQKFQGITGEIFVMPDRDDIINSFRNSFLARMTELGGIEKWTYGQNKTAYKFQELL